MPGRECYHCRQWVDDKQVHDCWSTTEEKHTQDLSEDLQDAWARLRETAVSFGEQRIYASHRSIMFSRKVCYCFVRPTKNRLEVCFFLGREEKSPPVRKTYASTKVKTAHMVYLTHRDEVEAPITDWLKEAYDVSMTLKPAPKAPTTKKKTARKRKKTSAKKKKKPKQTKAKRKTR